MDDHGHIPVLADQTLKLLEPRPGDVVVDCTVGRGGHAMLLAQAVAPGGRILGFDLDRGNLEHAARRLADAQVPFEPIHDSFVRVAHHLRQRDLQADVLLADLGFSSSQMDDPARGLSFSADGPLDMRLDQSARVTAAQLIGSLPEDELADILQRYGQEPLARKIALFVVRQRQEQPIQTTAQLARLVREAYGRRSRQSRMDPATRTFMALRIAVNDELGALDGLLDQIDRGATGTGGWIRPGARVAVISFHSLEDRLVKRAFLGLERRGLATRPTNRPVTATDAERQANRRSRSAKLRVARIGAP
jgi:16S rRNA (cytosine1402-N4)-methyltransferase